MRRETVNIIDKVISEEINKRILSLKNKIFENKDMKKEMCSECGSTNVMEGECMECGTMREGQMCSECGGKMNEGECMECGSMYEGDIQELGGMDDGHPRFGKKRLPKRMSPEEIEKLLRGSDEKENDYHGNTDKSERKTRRRGGDKEMKETKYVTSKGGKFDKEKMPPSRQDIETNIPGFDMEEFCSHYYNENLPECQSYYNHNSGGELDERLYGNQKRIDKNKNGRIDRQDFKMLRKESVYEVTLDNNDKFRFNESEIVDVIEKIISEEKKKKSSTNPKTKTKVNNVTKSSQTRSKKENDDNIEMVGKKMKDYLKMGSKGKYEMNPKHFPKGNGELEKMDKMAYIPSNAVQDYIDNFTAAGLENIDFKDGIQPNEDWMNDLLDGASRTGNNPDWANAVETPVNKKRNKIRKDNLLGKIKRQAYNKAPQPVNDVAGNQTDKASKIMLKLESEENRPVITDIDKMKTLMGYNRKTQ